MVMGQLAIAVAGFSVLSLILLVFQKRDESRAAFIFSNMLLFVLVMTQLFQVLFILRVFETNDINKAVYLFLLGLVGPVFYLYSQFVLQNSRQWSFREIYHFIPASILCLTALLWPGKYTAYYIVVFLLGGIYMAYLGWSLYKIRQRRSLFKMEFIFTGCFLSWAVAVVIVGAFGAQEFVALLPAQIFMLALAVAGAMYIQLNFPHLLSSLEEMASRTYQSSTLSHIDSEDVKRRLDELMADKMIVQDSQLSLTSLSQMLSVKPNQLSEILNTQLGVSFSFYLRTKRVRAAERLLLDEPEVSVLAVGLEVGFNSQSAFYAAFKELNSVAPAHFRKQHIEKYA